MLLANIVPRDLRIVSEQMNVHYIEGGGGTPQSLWWGGSSNSSDPQIQRAVVVCVTVSDKAGLRPTVCGLHFTL